MNTNILKKIALYIVFGFLIGSFSLFSTEKEILKEQYNIIETMFSSGLLKSGKQNSYTPKQAAVLTVSALITCRGGDNLSNSEVDINLLRGVQALVVSFSKEIKELFPKDIKRITKLIARLNENISLFEKESPNKNASFILDKPDFDNQLRKAEYFLKKGEFEQSQLVLDQIIKNSPNNADALFSRAYLFVLLNEHDKAIEDYRRILDKSPDAIPALLPLGKIYFYKNQLKESRECMEKILFRVEDHFEARLIKGDILLLTENPDSAIVEFKKALFYYPENPILLRGIAHAYFLKNEVRHSRLHLEKSKVADPESTLTYLQSSAYEIIWGDIRSSLQNLEDGMRNIPQSYELALMKGHYLAHSGLYRDSADSFIRALSLNSRSLEAMISLGNVYFLLKDYENSLKLWKGAINLFPENAECHISAGIALRFLDKPLQAMWFIREGLKRDPNNSFGLFEQAILYFYRNEYEKTRKFLTLSIKHLKRFPVASIVMGYTSELMGYEKEAEKWYLRAYQENPASIDSMLEIARFFMRTGQLRKATSWYNKVLDSNPDNITANENLKQLKRKDNPLFDFAYLQEENKEHFDYTSLESSLDYFVNDSFNLKWKYRRDNLNPWINPSEIGFYSGMVRTHLIGNFEEAQKYYRGDLQNFAGDVTDDMVNRYLLEKYNLPLEWSLGSPFSKKVHRNVVNIGLDYRMNYEWSMDLDIFHNTYSVKDSTDNFNAVAKYRKGNTFADFIFSSEDLLLNSLSVFVPTIKAREMAIKWGYYFNPNLSISVKPSVEIFDDSNKNTGFGTEIIYFAEWLKGLSFKYNYQRSNFDSVYDSADLIYIYDPYESLNTYKGAVAYDFMIDDNLWLGAGYTYQRSRYDKFDNYFDAIIHSYDTYLNYQLMENAGFKFDYRYFKPNNEEGTNLFYLNGYIRF